jgi:hypothetical protein
MKTERTLSSLPRKKALDREDQGTSLYPKRLKNFRALQSVAIDNTKNTKKKKREERKNNLLFVISVAQKFCEEKGVGYN